MLGWGAWLSVLVLGLLWLVDYGGRPGPRGVVPASWSEGLRDGADERRATLMVFCHPRCPCTRSTLRELRRVLAHDGLAVRCEVHFYRPADEPDAWARTELWRTAAATPGVEVVVDPDGERARSFGALTSGHAVLYGASGELLFEGGLTIARGHDGESPGSASILASLLEDEPGETSTPIYGCPIQDAEGGAACPQ